MVASGVNELLDGSPFSFEILPCALFLDTAVAEDDDVVCCFEKPGCGKNVNIQMPTQGQSTKGLTRVADQHNRRLEHPEKPIRP